MKKKLVITTLSLCMILAAAPAQAFAGSTNACQNGAATCQNAANAVLGKYLNSCSSYSDCRGALLKACASLQKPACNGGSGNDCNNGSSNGSINNNSLNSWQSQVQDFLDKYLGGSNSGEAEDNNTNSNTDNDANNDANNDATETPSVEQNSNAGSSDQAESSSVVGSYEKQVADIVNKERAAAGLSSLKLDSKLSAVAEKKAEDMRDKGYFSHTSPTYGSPFEMMTQFGIKYSAAGENIAKGQKTPSSVMNAWMNSSGHKANILNSNFENIGVGYVTDSNGTTYWVQMFTK